MAIIETQNKQVLKQTLAVILVASVLGGCATPNDPRDPMEGFNRAMFGFNEVVDKAVIRPVALGYDAVAPLPVRSGVGNFFSNIGDVFIGVNNALQGKMPEAGSDIARVLINTTVGILGFFDVASEMGLEKHEEDFGQTLGRWGVGDGPYVVLPIFGPRTLRDSAGLAVDLEADPVANQPTVSTRNTLTGVRLVDIRAGYLPADKVIEEAALDKYSYIREAYLQRRRNLIYDGTPPRLPDDAMSSVGPTSTDMHLAVTTPNQQAEPWSSYTGPSVIVAPESASVAQATNLKD